MMGYTKHLIRDEFLDLMTIQEFKNFIDLVGSDQGFGFPVKDNMVDESIQIGAVDSIPADATHISWYNK